LLVLKFVGVSGIVVTQETTTTAFEVHCLENTENLETWNEKLEKSYAKHPNSHVHLSNYFPTVSRFALPMLKVKQN